MGQWAICTIGLPKFFRDFQWGLVALVGHGQLSDADSCATDGEVSRETARKQCLWFLTNRIMSMDIQLHGSGMLRHSILLMSRHCSAQVFPSLTFQTSSVHGLLRNNLTIQSVTSSRHPHLEFGDGLRPKVRTTCRFNLTRWLPTLSRYLERASVWGSRLSMELLHIQFDNVLSTASKFRPNSINSYKPRVLKFRSVYFQQPRVF